MLLELLPRLSFFDSFFDFFLCLPDSGLAFFVETSCWCDLYYVTSWLYYIYSAKRCNSDVEHKKHVYEFSQPANRRRALDGNHYDCRTCSTDWKKSVYKRCLLWTWRCCDGKPQHVIHLQAQTSKRTNWFRAILVSKHGQYVNIYLQIANRRHPISGHDSPGICLRTSAHGGRMLLRARLHCILLFPAYFNICETWRTANSRLVNKLLSLVDKTYSDVPQTGRFLRSI